MPFIKAPVDVGHNIRRPLARYIHTDEGYVPVKLRRDEGEPVDECVKRILVLADLNVTNKFWGGVDDPSEHPVWNFVSPYEDEFETFYKGRFECPTQYEDYNCTVELTFASNYTRQMMDKDAVVFNTVPETLFRNSDDLFNYYHMQMEQNQLWLFYSLETPVWNHKGLNKKNIPNLPVHEVWSYNSDSKMYNPQSYYNYNPRSDTSKRKRWNDLRKLKRKKRLVMWMGSNCNRTHWPRMDFVHELQRHVQLDTYGACGNYTCSRNSAECRNLISSYKFYLSVENAECDDYITEKVWLNALQRGVVPIVYGARKKDYQKFLPPHSFIYAGDFKTVEMLGKYLQKLDQRPALYYRYFRWKGSITGSVAFKRKDFCNALPLIDQVQNGDLEKRPLYTFPWFNTCRINPANYTELVTFEDWKPWL